MRVKQPCPCGGIPWRMHAADCPVGDLEDRLDEAVALLREVSDVTMARQSRLVRSSTLGAIDAFLKRKPVPYGQ